MDAPQGRLPRDGLGNLKTFVYGILGVKYDWMLTKGLSEPQDNNSSRSSKERVSPAMRLLGSQWKDVGKEAVQNKIKHGHVKSESGSKGFYTLNLFNTSPLRTSISSALQNFENEKILSKQMAQYEAMSTKLGDTVGNFDSEGRFHFNKKVEIRKINMHYKILADNRAKHVRKKKLETSESKESTHAPKSKIDHKKYLMKPPKSYEPKQPVNIQTKTTYKMVEENQGQSLHNEEEYKTFKPKEKF